MKKIIYIFIVIVVSISTSPLLSQRSEQLKHKTLIFATEATYPPFVFMQGNSTISGFDADIIHAICQQLQQPCQLVNAPWDSLIPSLRLGKYDAIFGGMQILPQREKVVDFSMPYYTDTVTFVVNKKNNVTLDKTGITGKTIGVQVGTTFVQYLQLQYGNHIKIKTYPSALTALLDLQAGRVDAVFVDKPVAVNWLKKQQDKTFITKGDITDPHWFGKGYAIAVKKDNIALLTAINKALVNIKQNGTYTKIERRWGMDR